MPGNFLNEIRNSNDKLRLTIFLKVLNFDRIYNKKIWRNYYYKLRAKKKCINFGFRQQKQGIEILNNKHKIS